MIKKNQDNIVLFSLAFATFLSWCTSEIIIAVIVFSLVSILNVVFFRKNLYYLALVLMFFPAIKELASDMTLELEDKKYLITISIYVVILAISLIITNIRLKKLELKSYFTLPLLLFIGAFILSWITTISLRISVLETLAFILFVYLAYLILTGIKGSEGDKRLFSKVVIAFALICISQMFYILLKSDNPIHLITKKGIAVGWDWGNINNIAQYILFAIPFTFYLISRKRAVPIYITILIVLLSGILITNSRASFIGLAVVAVLMFYFAARYAFNKVFTARNILVFTSLAIITTVFLVKSKLLEGVINRNFSDGLYINDSGRLDLFKLGWEAFKENPLLGKGAFTYRLFLDFMSTHNWVLDFLSTIGIIGLAAFLFLTFRQLKFLYKKKTIFSMLFLVLLIAMLVTNLLDIGYINYRYWLPLLVGIGIAEKESVKALPDKVNIYREL